MSETKTTTHTEYWLSVPMWLILSTGLAVILHCLTWQWGPIAVARDIDRLEQRVKALEQQIKPIDKRRDVQWPFRSRDEEQAALKKAMAERAKEAGR